ncbi:unnamed protein product [Paramecium octaurelia]|uniref:Uncharacterized protein n=1 Tax=Paramecium octaurelia TaxID=43137 RepID=A0A8S1V6W8_PAROT|nr:unnamed protein product [Paramecium octaurelia]
MVKSEILEVNLLKTSTLSHSGFDQQIEMRKNDLLEFILN